MSTTASVSLPYSVPLVVELFAKLPSLNAASFVFSQESRYYSNTSPPKRLLYGSFTGPGCVYMYVCVVAQGINSH